MHHIQCRARPSGYEMYLKAIADPREPSHEAMREWDVPTSIQLSWMSQAFGATWRISQNTRDGVLTVAGNFCAEAGRSDPFSREVVFRAVRARGIRRSGNAQRTMPPASYSPRSARARYTGSSRSRRPAGQPWCRFPVLSRKVADPLPVLHYRTVWQSAIHRCGARTDQRTGRTS